MRSQLKAGIYLSYISIFISNITNLILTPFIIKNLGQSEYGVYMLIGALIGYIAVLDFGLGNTTVRYVAKYRAEGNKEKEENFLFYTFFLYFLISIILLFVGLLIYFNLDRIFENSLTTDEIVLAKRMFLILIINLTFTLPMKSIVGIINAYERFIFPRSLSIGRILVRALLIVILLLLGYKALAIVLVDTLLNLIMMILNLLYVLLRLKVRIKFHIFDLKIIKQILSFSFLIFISVLVDQFYWRIGHLVLGIVASASEVALFAIGITFSNYFITFSTAISGVFLPRITSMVVKKARGEELTDLLIKTGRLQLIVLGLALGGFVLFGRKFIVLWLGNNFEISWYIALIVIIPLTIVLTQTIGISILQAKNMHGFRAIIYLGISLLSLFLSVPMAKKFGAIGATIGTSVSLILGNIIIMNFYYNYKVGLNILRFFKEVSKGIFPSIIISMFIGLLLLYFKELSWSTFILQAILYTFLYTVIMWLVGMNNNEKKLFKGEFSKILKLVRR